MVLRKASYPADFELDVELAEADEYLSNGGSAIIAPSGECLAGPLWHEEGILYAELDLNQVLAHGQLLDVAGHYARPDVFEFRLNEAFQRGPTPGTANPKSLIAPPTSLPRSGPPLW
jgi:nitrilase